MGDDSSRVDEVPIAVGLVSMPPSERSRVALTENGDHCSKYSQNQQGDVLLRMPAWKRHLPKLPHKREGTVVCFQQIS